MIIRKTRRPQHLGNLVRKLSKQHLGKIFYIEFFKCPNTSTPHGQHESSVLRLVNRLDKSVNYSLYLLVFMDNIVFNNCVLYSSIALHNLFGLKRINGLSDDPQTMSFYLLLKNTHIAFSRQ